MRLTWNAFYAFLFLYRCAASVFAQLVLMRITLIADTQHYQNQNFNSAISLAKSIDPSIAWLMRGIATDLTGLVAGIFSFLFMGNPILINIGFQSIAFIGIVTLLRSVDPNARKWLAILVMLPSFTLWSSMTAKEPLVVFFVCILLKYVIDIYHNREKFRLYHILTLALLYIFKPHFLPAIIFLMFISKIAKMTRYPATLALTAGSFSLYLLYLMRDLVDRVALIIGEWVNEPGLSSRPGTLLTEQYDIFTKAPEGMLLAFMGPTLSEASGRVLHLISYAESSFMLLMLFFYIFIRLPSIPAYSFFIGIFTVFWIMFAVYPLGTNNPGTAVRFRTDFIMIIYVAVIVIMSRSLYINWREMISPSNGLKRLIPNNRIPAAET